MHRFPLEPVQAIAKMSKEEQAEIAAYRDEESGDLYIPGVAIQRALIAAATYSKGKGRASLQKPVAACVFVDPDQCSLGTTTYKIDARAVVVPATKGRIVRFRPRLDAWEIAFSLDYDPDLLTEQQLRTVVDDAGARVGLLDFRPERKGPFGRFMVTFWEGGVRIVAHPPPHCHIHTQSGIVV
ncbi:MAG: hypothetical protein PHD55_07900 [Methanoregula sp.]|nr:hypothetical protein [Methanoregula sp.]